MSLELWKSYVAFAQRCNADFNGGNLDSWKDGLNVVENASRDFLAFWQEACRQHGKYLLEMTAQELTDMGCTSVITIPLVGRIVEVQPTTPGGSQPTGTRSKLKRALDEVHKMGEEIDTMKDEILLLNDSMEMVAEDTKSIQDQTKELVSIVEKVAHIVQAQSRTLSAVKT